MKKIIILIVFSLCGFISSQNFDRPFHFPFQDPDKDYSGRWQLISKDNLLFAFYSAEVSMYKPALYYRISTNGGSTWSTEKLVTYPDIIAGSINISACVTSTGRIIVIYSLRSDTPTKIVFSDNNGLTWSSPANIIGSSLYIEYPHLSISPDNKILISGSPTNHFFITTDNGVSWTAKSTGFRIHVLSVIDENKFMGFYLQNDNIYFRKTTDGGDSWSSGTLLRDDNNVIYYITAFWNNDGQLGLVYSVQRPTPFYNIFQGDLVMMTSSDSGEVWSSPVDITLYRGYDSRTNFYTYNGAVFLNFSSGRYLGRVHTWAYKIGTTQDINTPPAILSYYHEVRYPELFITLMADGENAITGMKVHYSVNSILTDSTALFDDGLHEDSSAGDNIWACSIGPFDPGAFISWGFSGTDITGNYFIGRGESASNNIGLRFNYLTSGSLHNWYNSMGSEKEEGWIQQQLYGLDYPSGYPYQDMQASKGFWMGAKNFTDENGMFWAYKVIHCGPRVTGEGEFFPVSFTTKARFEHPEIIVDGISITSNTKIDVIDPEMEADIEILNEINTQLGISVKRRIFQFSHPGHDNYIINEYTIKNTGNTDLDPAVELPANNITDLNLFYIFRWAVCAQTRYVIGNPTGWGINTMLDARGDGVMPDPPGENYRTIFGWHGYWPDKIVSYDNIGAPVWLPDIGGYVTADDTIGRLGAVQFPGVLTLHADVSASNHSDNPQQPSSTLFVDSDNNLLYNNNPYDSAKMRQEYLLITKGHDNPRHAWMVEPSGNFTQQVNYPNLGTPGGFSAANGYGPYNLAFGDSIKIIWVEGAAGISREEAINTGKLFKQGTINAYQKNLVVLTGKDSLMKTWQNAVINYNSGYNLPELPLPPKKFKLDSYSNRIDLSWEAFANSGAVKYRIYRSMSIADSLFRMIYECPADTFSYSDYDIILNKSYRYYIASVNNAGLESNKTYTIIPGGIGILTDVKDENTVPGEFSLLQNYPNPFNPLTRIKFLISEQSFTTLKIYDILGNEVAVLVNNELSPGSHEVSFDGKNLSSGVYIYRLHSGEYSQTRKMILLK